MNMMSCCLGDLRDKEVINTCNGRRLGYVTDVEIDLCAGRLVAIMVPGECGGGFFSRAQDLRIPWEKIERIGKDTILVAVTELPPCCDEDKGKRKMRFF
jgi:YlmC/YmxH family sporulation protein